MDYNKASLESRKNGSPLFTWINAELNNKDDLSVYYSPGIAEPCKVIHQDKSQSKKLTIKKNTIAVISDGSAVLWLWNIWPEAALPVMEWKCMLFKKFADVNAIPVVLNTQDTQEIVKTIKNISPTLWWINLEDISAPRCFEIEAQLSQDLDIPVFHDDQDGTAMVTTAALKNALKIVKKDKTKINVVISWAGAAWIAIAKMITVWWVQNITMLDSKWIVNCEIPDLDSSKRQFCSYQIWTLKDAIVWADVFIWVSAWWILKKEMVETMATDPIIFALANPEPEIMPDLAKQAWARIVATGRSDFPNQINNVLIFPWFFKGLLENWIVKIDYKLKLKAMEALADLVENPTEDYIIPTPFDQKVVPAVSGALK